MKHFTPFLIFTFQLLSLNVWGQAENIVIKDGFFEPIVQVVSNVSADSGYLKLKEWINYNYRNADAVIGSSIENKFVRFTGIETGFAKCFGYLYDLEYTIRIDFKDNRYRFVVEKIRSGFNGVFANIILADYYKNGEPRKAYKSYTDGIEKTINEINSSLYQYLTGQRKVDNW